MSAHPPSGDPGAGEAGGAGGAGSDQRDFYGDELHPMRLRGLVVVAAAVALCVLLLPSATRAPSTAAASSSTAAPSTPTTTAPSHAVGRASTTTAPSRGTTTTTLPAPATVHVLVANGTTTNGVAGAVTTFLGQKGYGTLTATNALTRVSATKVYPTGGSVAAAQEVATALGLPVSSVQAVGATAPVSSAAGATVVVIAGPDLAARFAPSAQG